MSFKYLIYVQHILEILTQFHNLDLGIDIVQRPEISTNYVVRPRPWGYVKTVFLSCLHAEYIVSHQKHLSVLILGQGREGVGGFIFSLRWSCSRSTDSVCFYIFVTVLFYTSLYWLIFDKTEKLVIPSKQLYIRIIQKKKSIDFNYRQDFVLFSLQVLHVF